MTNNERLDGWLRVTVTSDVAPGAVFRMVQSDGTVPPFSDFVVNRVEAGVATLARPHAHGVEGIDVPVQTMCGRGSLFRTVMTARGAVYHMELL